MDPQQSYQPIEIKGELRHIELDEEKGGEEVF
jgi:hypothetical protein